MSKLQVSVQHGILETRNLERIPVGSEEWFEWLEKNKAFRFEYDGQSFSARKESPIKKTASDSGYGEPEYDEEKAYWQAYRKVDGKTRKRYIGKSGTLTQERLMEISKTLDEPAAPKPAKELPIRLSDTEATQLESKAFRAQTNYDEAQKTIDRLEGENAELHNKLRDYQSKLQKQEAELHNKLRDLEERCTQLEAEKLTDQQSEPAESALDLPEPAILLNQLKGKHPKSKVSLKDVEAILSLLEG